MKTSCKGKKTRPKEKKTKKVIVTHKPALCKKCYNPTKPVLCLYKRELNFYLRALTLFLWGLCLPFPAFRLNKSFKLDSGIFYYFRLTEQCHMYPFPQHLSCESNLMFVHRYLTV